MKKAVRKAESKASEYVLLYDDGWFCCRKIWTHRKRSAEIGVTSEKIIAAIFCLDNNTSSQFRTSHDGPNIKGFVCCAAILVSYCSVHL